MDLNFIKDYKKVSTEYKYHRNKAKRYLTKVKALEKKYGPEWHKVLIDLSRTPEAIRKRKETYLKNGYRPSTQQLMTDDAITKKKETYKRIEHQRGAKNSQHGTMWIFNEELKQSKKIKKADVIPDGWCKGRKMF